MPDLPPSAPDPSPAPAQPAPGESVLDVVERLTGEAPKVLLREEGSGLGATPFVAVRGDTGELAPQGRGNYQVLGEIARGGMGLVLKGHDRDLGRDVAIKVLDAKLASRPAVVQRFVEEAQIGGQLQHPGVVPVYELGMMADARPFFAMKLVKGRTLQSLLSRRASLDEDRRRFLTIFESVCQTIGYAHSKGVVHRDLKPANVMVGAFGEVQVVDWGLAKVLRQGGVEDERRARREQLTVIETVRSGPGSSGSDSVAGSVMGTPAYMPPEQARGDVDAVDERSDVFALGALLCEILTGQPPYVEREGGERLIVQASQAQLGPARERIEGCAAEPELRTVCLGCLSPAPQARPQSAGELAERVQRFMAATEERAREAQVEAAAQRVKAAEERKARRLTLALAAAVVALLVVAGGGLTWAREQQRARADELRERIDEARAQVGELQAAGRLEQAVEAARATLALVEAEETDAAQREQAVRLLAQAEAQRDAARADAQRLESNRRLLARLAELRSRQSGYTASVSGLTREALDADFAAAFAEAGIELDADDPVAALEQVRRRGLAADLALALDDWARLRRVVYGWRSGEAEALTALAADLDPDPQRMLVREALFEQDEGRLLELAADPDTESLPASTQWVLANALQDLGRSDEAMDLLERAATRHPEDYRLRAAAAEAANERDQAQFALSHAHAALALQPENPSVWFLVADAHFNVGDLDRARGWYERALARQPEVPGGWNLLGYCRLFLDDYGGALEAWNEAVSRSNNTSYSAAALLARYFLDELPGADFLSRLQPLRTDLYIDQLAAFGLLDHPDPARRDPQRALELIEEMLARSQPDDWLTWLVLAMAQEQLGRPDEVLAAVGRVDSLEASLRRDIALRFELLEARAHHARGDASSARRTLARAKSEFALLAGTTPSAWEGRRMNDLVSETEALIGG